MLKRETSLREIAITWSLLKSASPALDGVMQKFEIERTATKAWSAPSSREKSRTRPASGRLSTTE
jgi:hypothetical protein